MLSYRKSVTIILYCERDDTVAAIQSVIDGVRLSAVLHKGSSLLDELVRISCENFAIRSLEYVIANTDPSDASLQELDSMLAEHSDMRTGILGEIVHTKQFYEGMSDLSWSEIKTMIEFSQPHPHQFLIACLPVSSGWIRMNKAYHLELLHHVATTWHLPWQDFRNRYVEASDSIPWFYFLPNLKTAPYFLVNISEYTYSYVKKRELRARGTWRCARIAVAIERYSQEHGEIPHSLRVLLPTYLDDLPTEPFQSKPFEYASNGKTGVLKFECPDSGKDFTFKVFASK